jgi:hypothetical protein
MRDVDCAAAMPEKLSNAKKIYLLKAMQALLSGLNRERMGLYKYGFRVAHQKMYD